MIDYIKNISVCIIASMATYFLSEQLGSTFFKELIGSLLEVVCGIFAINIASTALIAELINKVSEKTGHSLDKSKQALIAELRIQLVLILAVVFFMVFYYADIPKTSLLYQFKDIISYLSKISMLSIFIYFVWITYDLGKSLFVVLEATKK